MKDDPPAGLNEAHLAALHGLLHDIGKPAVRLLLRSNWSLSNVIPLVVEDASRAGEIDEKERSEFARFATKIFNSIVRHRGEEYAHEAVWTCIAEILEQKLKMKLERPNVLAAAVRVADMESASERLSVPLTAGNLRLSHHTSPFLSPYALLHLLGFSTHDTVSVHVDKARSCIALKELYRKCRLAASSSCRKTLRNHLGHISRGGLVGKLADLPVWHPVRPLRWQDKPEVYYPGKLDCSSCAVDYKAVNASLLAGIYRLLELVDIASRYGVSLDIIRALTAVYRRSLLFVPSAVYGGRESIVLPEISLYAHSRVVAAFASALILSAKSCKRLCYRLLMIDLMNIQRYITQHRTVTAAVRALRGRSLVVELAQRAAANYVLNMLGLPWTSVYTYEGGVVSIVAPCCRDLEKVVNSLEEAFNEEFGGVLGVTGGYTRTVDVKPSVKEGYSRYNFDPENPDSFTAILDEARMRIAEKKAQAEVKNGRLKVIPPEQLAYDPFTESSVPSEKYVYYGGDLNDEYWKAIAGDDGAALVEREGGVSVDTHRALVAGTASPNLIAIIELYPDRECNVEELFKDVSITLFNSPYRRYRVVSVGGANLKLALIDFPRLYAGYILIAYNSIGELDSDRLWGAITAVAQILSKALRRQCRLKIIITMVNRVEFFLPPPRYAEEILKSLSSAGPIEVSFDWIAVNTRYPTKVDEKGNVVLKPLEEAAVTGWVALVKMDGDNMGNVMYYMSSSPSRLATASEILAVTMGLLGYKLVEEAVKAGKELGVYVMYMGGDDAVFFGDLPSTLEIAVKIAELYSRMLPGMTISAGVSVEDVKLPLYLSYLEALELLERAKEEPAVLTPRDDRKVQGTVAIGQMTVPISLCTCDDRRELISLKWRGYYSLQKPLELAKADGACEAADKLARILVGLTDKLLSAIHYKGCPVTGPEAAETMIGYAYAKAKLAEAQLEIEEILEKLTGIRPDYPPSDSNRRHTARLELQLALLLSRNQLNILYQLCRVAGKV